MKDLPDQTEKPDSAREDFVAVMVAAKTRAEAVLKELLTAAAECESQLQKQSRTDPMRLVTGRSSLDAAITDTRRMIEAFDRSVQDAKRAFGRAGKVGPQVVAEVADATLAGLTDSILWIGPKKMRAGLA